MKAAIALFTGALCFCCGKSGGHSKDATNDVKTTLEVSANTDVTPQVRDTSESTASTDLAAPLQCTRQAFASTIDLAEASGATWMADDSLLVIGDSGTNGAFLRLSAADGTVLNRGKLPLDTQASDDLEGLSRIGSTLYGVTSSGYIREWQAKGQGFALTRKSYSLAPKNDTKNVCKSPKDSNCGPNYEGLCLMPTPRTDRPCVGYVAAKATGRLVCVEQKKDGRLAIRPNHFITVSSPKTLSGCHFDGDGRLWFGNNVFAANAVGFATGHDRPESVVITRLGPLGLGFPEAIAVGNANEVYRFSDTAGSPSLLDKYICR